MEETKICCKCKKALPKNMFSKHKLKSDGLNSFCKECGNKYLKEWKKTESGKKSSKKYYEKTRDRWLKYSKKRNYVVCREQRVSITNSMKEETLRYYGNNELRCVRCGFSDIRALALDHINNDGNIERKKIVIGNRKGGYYFYKHLKDLGFPYGYQTLCYNCNIIKHRENMDNIAKQKIAEYSKGK